MLTSDEKATLKCDVICQLSHGVERIKGHAVEYLCEMLRSIYEDRVDRAGGPSQGVFLCLRAADDLLVIDRWISEEFPGQYPIGRNRITDLFTPFNSYSKDL